MKVPYKSFVLLSLLITDSIYCIDPITVGTVVAIGGGYLVNKLYDTLYSGDCGDHVLNWSKADAVALSKVLEKKLYGQHLVKKVITRGLMGHLMNDKPKKPLVLSFHGWTGGGKNFVSKFIAESIFKQGVDSPYVRTFISTIHFPQEDKAEIYGLNLQKWIKGNVTECPRTFFIFDEIDKIPLGTIDFIKPFIDYHRKIDGVDYRHSIFLFLSNTGGPDITKWMMDRWNDGKNREDITLKDMEYLIEKRLFNEVGGLHDSELVRHNLVDYYVPFLPLERKHVEFCIRDELLRRGTVPTKNLITRVANEMNYWPPEVRLFSLTGCKRVAHKVAFILADIFYDNLFD